MSSAGSPPAWHFIFSHLAQDCGYALLSVCRIFWCNWQVIPGIWFRIAWPRYTFCFALSCVCLYTWRGWWRGYPAFHVASGVVMSSSSSFQHASKTLHKNLISLKHPPPLNPPFWTPMFFWRFLGPDTVGLGAKWPIRFFGAR
jgi:hypothetical protein